VEAPAPAGAGSPEVAALLAARDEARRRREWARADEIRGRISALGFRVEDSPQGSRAVREP
jgi:cysteinyl-tRNA synthetase